MAKPIYENETETGGLLKLDHFKSKFQNYPITMKISVPVLQERVRPILARSSLIATFRTNSAMVSPHVADEVRFDFNFSFKDSHHGFIMYIICIMLLLFVFLY